MKKTKEHFQDLRYTASMPKEVFESIKDKNKVNLFSIYDAEMYQYYKNNAEWQEAEHEYKLAREKKQFIESEIDFKMIKNK